jgi:phosphate transport system permease protein
VTLEQTQPLTVVGTAPAAPTSIPMIPVAPDGPAFATHVVAPTPTIPASSAIPMTTASTYVVPTRTADAAPPRPRTISVIKWGDVAAIVGSAAAAGAVTWLMFQWVAPLTGFLGALLVWYVVFVVLYSIAIRLAYPGPIVKDKVAAVAMHTFALLLLLTLSIIIIYTLIRGWQALPHGNFFTQDMSNAGPLDPLDVGGIMHAIVGTLIMISIALVVTIPLGITCAVFLSEIPGRFSLFVRTITEAMTALPSIVAGLFIYATLILTLGVPKSGFAAAMAISVMMLPIIIRASDVVLRLVPGTLKEASYAVGAGQWRTVWNVTLPTARSGLTTAVILGTARGIGETSPVLLTAGFTAALNTNPFNGPMVSLPLATFEFVKSSQQNFIIRGFGTAAVLLLLVLVLFVIARIIGGRGPGNLSSRQQKSRVRQSRHDLERFERKVAEAAAPKIPGAQLATVGAPSHVAGPSASAAAPIVTVADAAPAVETPPIQAIPPTAPGHVPPLGFDPTAHGYGSNGATGANGHNGNGHGMPGPTAPFDPPDPSTGGTS